MKNNTIKKDEKEYKDEMNFLNEIEIELIEVDPLKEIDHELNDIFIPNWNNKPEPVPPVILLNGISILTYQNTSSIIALPGYGKSSIFESILSNIINNDCDSLGFEVNLDVVKKAVFIDFERRTNDVWDSFNRMCKRSGLKENDRIDNVWMFGFHAISNFEKRKDILEKVINEIKPELILLDGAGDLVKSTNDEIESINLRHWFREISNKYQCSILTTLHPNPGGEKPRGWIGSELTRESESVLIVRRDSDGIHTITTDFAHGKNRNSGKAESTYKFDEEKRMFVSCDPRKGYKKDISTLPTEKLISILDKIGITEKTGITAGEIRKLMKDEIKRLDPSLKTSNQDLNFYIEFLENNDVISFIPSKNSKIYYRNPELF
jgi:hypothetical protein